MGKLALDYEKKQSIDPYLKSAVRLIRQIRKTEGKLNGTETVKGSK